MNNFINNFNNVYLYIFRIIIELKKSHIHIYANICRNVINYYIIIEQKSYLIQVKSE